MKQALRASHSWSAHKGGFFTPRTRVSPPQLRSHTNNFFRQCTTTTASVPQWLLNTPPTQISTLRNGLRVATEESNSELASIGVFIDAGTVSETERINGVAHFLEHMAFKGTKSRTRVQLEEEIENIGGSLNAYTSREQTAYVAKVFKKDVPKAVDILSDILLNSTLNEESIESERSTILREAKEVAKNMQEVIFDHLHAGAFQGTPLARNILGPEEHIKSITRNDLLEYISKNYHAPRMVVAAAGAIKHDEFAKLAEKAFERLPADNTNEQHLDRPKTHWTGSCITIRDDLEELAHYVIGVEGVAAAHPDYYVIMVMNTILGSWDRNAGAGKNVSSRLCEEIAKKNLAHSLSTFHTPYSDTGVFGAYAIGPAEKMPDVVYAITWEWNRIGKRITQLEVERAKEKLKASVLMHLDGTTPICEDIARQVLCYGRRLTPAEIWLRIDAVTIDDVMRVAREHCEDAEPAVVGVGAIGAELDYAFVREWTSWKFF